MKRGKLQWGGMAYAVMCVLLLGGCATNSASTLIEVSRSDKEPPPQLPGADVVKQELAGRALQLGRVYAELPGDSAEERMNVKPESLVAAFERPLRQAFTAAKLGEGKTPAYTVDCAIVAARLREGVTLRANAFRVRMDVVRPDQSRVMAAAFESRYLVTIPVIFPGIVGALPTYNSPLTALSLMMPATAVVVTRTAAGLQQGKTLDQIAVYPDDASAGGMISPPATYLKQHPYGLAQLPAADLADIARQIRAQP